MKPSSITTPHTTASKRACEISIEDHAMLILYGCGELGFGFRCEDAYKALLEIASTLQALYGWAAYTPVGVLAELEADANRVLINREFEKETANVTKN